MFPRRETAQLGPPPPPTEIDKKTHSLSEKSSLGNLSNNLGACDGLKKKIFSSNCLNKTNQSLIRSEKSINSIPITS